MRLAGSTALVTGAPRPGRHPHIVCTCTATRLQPLLSGKLRACFVVAGCERSCRRAPSMIHDRFIEASLFYSHKTIVHPATLRRGEWDRACVCARRGGGRRSRRAAGRGCSRTRRGQRSEPYELWRSGVHPHGRHRSSQSPRHAHHLGSGRSRRAAGYAAAARLGPLHIVLNSAVRGRCAACVTLRRG